MECWTAELQQRLEDAWDSRLPIDRPKDSVPTVQQCIAADLADLDGPGLRSHTAKMREEDRQAPSAEVALRSNGLIQPLVLPRWPDYTKPSEPNRLGDEESFAEPAEPRFYVCQDTLFDGARQAKTIREFLANEMRCVIE